MSRVRLAIHGATGRMGLRLIALACESPHIEVVEAVDYAGSGRVGQNVGALAGVPQLNLPVTEQIAGKAQVVIDFSTPPSARSVLAACEQQRTALVIGTTGLTPDDQSAIDHAAMRIAVLQAPNMSLGVNLLFALAGEVAKRLGDDYDIEITEAHHRFKKDAPSGTALGIAQSICQATNKDPQKVLVHGREGDHELRQRGTIGMHALRMGDVVGDHSVHYATLGERLTLSHTASTRDVFARGALRAAAFLADKKPARYTMKDVLGL